MPYYFEELIMSSLSVSEWLQCPLSYNWESIEQIYSDYFRCAGFIDNVGEPWDNYPCEFIVSDIAKYLLEVGGLTAQEILDDIHEIDCPCNGMFWGLNLKSTSIIMPPRMTEVSFACFQGSDLESIDCSYIQVLTPQAFYRCKNLKEVQLKSVKTIEENAFGSCVNLKSLTLPKTIQKIDMYAFEDCERLDLYLPEQFKNLIQDDIDIWCEEHPGALGRIIGY